MGNFTFTAQDSLQLETFLRTLNQDVPATVRQQTAENVRKLADLKKYLLPFTYITLTQLGGNNYPGQYLKKTIGGIKKHLGYPEESFDFRKSMTVIFDIFRVMVIEYGKAAYLLLQNEDVRKKITPDTYYSISYLVRHINPEKGLIQVTQHSSAYAQHPDGSIAIQINVCYVHTGISANTLMQKPFFTHPCEGYMNREQQALHDVAIPRILDQIKRNNNNRPMLSPREYELSCLLSKGYPASNIALQHMNLSIDTTRRHCRNMLGKFRKWFPKVVQVEDAPHAARYLKNLGFLDYPECFIGKN